MSNKTITMPLTEYDNLVLKLKNANNLVERLNDKIIGSIEGMIAISLAYTNQWQTVPLILDQRIQVVTGTDEFIEVLYSELEELKEIRENNEELKEKYKDYENFKEEISDIVYGTFKAKNIVKKLEELLDE